MNGKAIFNRIRYILLFAGVFLIFLVVRRLGWNQFLSILSSLRFSYVILACIIWAIALLFASARFSLFLYSPLGFSEIFEIFLFGYLYNYAGGVQGIGVAARLGMLKLKDVDISKSSASIGAEIVCDAFVSLLILIGGIIFFGSDLMLKIKQAVSLKLILIPVIAFVIIIFTLVILNKKNLIRSFNRNLIRSLFSKRIAPGFGITMILFLLTSLVYYFVFRASGMIPGFLNIFFAFGSGYACGLLSLVPGGLGVRDIVFGYALSLSDIPFEKGVTISIVVRIICIGVIFLIIVFWQIIRFLSHNLRNLK